MKVYAVINQKGGVGKTTTVVNLGAVIASRGHDTCLIDLDPQAHLSLHLGIEPGRTDISIYDVLINEAELDSAAIRVAPHLTVVPSVIDLAGAEVELASKIGREQILRDRLSTSSLDCELAMIDCPPSLGLLTLNALAAADEVLIPLQPHFLALQGLGKLLETILLVKKRINPTLKVAGVIFCMYETSTRLAAEVVADLAQFIGSARGGEMPWSDARIFTRRIRRNIKLAECPSHGKTIFDYDGHSLGAQDYLALADEFLAMASGQGADADQAPACEHAPSEPAADAVGETPQTPPAESPATTAPAPAKPQDNEPQTPSDAQCSAAEPACADYSPTQPEGRPNPASPGAIGQP